MSQEEIASGFCKTLTKRAKDDEEFLSLKKIELLENIIRVKDAVNGIPVGYVDAYYEFENRPAITAMCDVLLTNCYPFWEGIDNEVPASKFKKSKRKYN